MKWTWDRRIARAEELAQTCSAAHDLLGAYARVAAVQKAIFEQISARPSSDPLCVASCLPRLLKAAEGAGAISQFRPQDVDALLLAHWNHEPTDDPRERFVARALLQPFAEALAMRGEITPDVSSRTCPFCGALPLVATLRGEGEGGRRSLICSLCATEWEFRRILCAGCGEENKDKLPVYVAPEFDYVRVEACDTCQSYIKCIDLTRNGLAVAPVDEIASVALNLWAEEHGYGKIEANLLGL